MHTKLRLLAILSLALLASACGNDDKAGASAEPNLAEPETTLSQEGFPEPESGSQHRKVPPIIPFDVSSIPVTNKDIGEFPFFMPPKGYRYITDTLTTLDESISIQEPSHHHYPVGNDRLYTVNGKVLRAWLYNEKLNKTSEPDLLLIHRYYEKAITAAGGVKVFDAEIKNVGIPKATTRNNLQRSYVIRKTDIEAWFEIGCSISGCVLVITQRGET